MYFKQEGGKGTMHQLLHDIIRLLFFHKSSRFFVFELNWSTNVWDISVKDILTIALSLQSWERVTPSLWWLVPTESVPPPDNLMISPSGYISWQLQRRGKPIFSSADRSQLVLENCSSIVEAYHQNIWTAAPNSVSVRPSVPLSVHKKIFCTAPYLILVEGPCRGPWPIKWFSTFNWCPVILKTPEHWPIPFRLISECSTSDEIYTSKYCLHYIWF